MIYSQRLRGETSRVAATLATACVAAACRNIGVMRLLGDGGSGQDARERADGGQCRLRAIDVLRGMCKVHTSYRGQTDVYELKPYISRMVAEFTYKNRP
jgi:hypothetical protein